MRRVRHGVAAALAAGMVLAPVGARRAWAQEMAFSQAQLVRSLLPTVVNITAKAEVAETQDPVMASAGGANAAGKAASASARYAVRSSAGSGFVIEPSGEIATNWHVVNNAFDIAVTFADGTRAKAELVNASALVDLAVIKVNLPRKLPAIRWGDSGKVQIGDPVLAIGNPLGIGLSVSAGIVSALNRNIMDTPYDNFIQTDAAINHGNSGGPLFDLRGEVIGVNSAIISPTAANAGLGFAMPANEARFIFERLTRKTLARPGWLGVRLQAVTPEMADALGMQEPLGCIVASVDADGPAAQAGLRAGDVILRYGAATPEDERALLRAIARTDPGARVTLGLRRARQTLEVPVQVREWPVMWWEDPASIGKPHLTVPPDLGLTVTALTDRTRASYDIAPEVSGVVVEGVLPGTDAAQRGLGPGDVIAQVDDVATASAEQWRQAIERARAERRAYALLLVQRSHQPVTPAQRPGPKWLALRVSP